jgi:uncharacterized protein YifE (UPF0438 family)
MKALTEIQNELKAPKNQYNSFGKYKYRSCEDILEAVKPLLKKHNCTLTITDSVEEVGSMVYVEAECVLRSKDDEVIVRAQAGIDPNRKGMDIAQSFGSSSSYARKYALNGLFLIDDTKDADATNEHGKGTNSKPITTPVKTEVKEGDKVFMAILKGVSEGKGTIEQAKAKYSISESVEASLKEKIRALKDVM